MYFPEVLSCSSSSSQGPLQFGDPTKRNELLYVYSGWQPRYYTNRRTNQLMKYILMFSLHYLIWAFLMRFTGKGQIIDLSFLRQKFFYIIIYCSTYICVRMTARLQQRSELSTIVRTKILFLKWSESDGNDAQIARNIQERIIVKFCNFLIYQMNRFQQTGRILYIGITRQTIIALLYQ